MEYYAHIDKNENSIRCQTVAEHYRNTVQMVAFMGYILFPDWTSEMRPFLRKYLVYMEVRLKWFDGAEEIFGTCLEGNCWCIIETNHMREYVRAA